MLKKELSIKIDYLSIVFDTLKADELIRRLLGLPLEYFMIQKAKVKRVYFESKISEGRTKIQALLCIMRRLVNIIYSMMKSQTAYRLPEKREIKESTEKEQMIS